MQTYSRPQNPVAKAIKAIPFEAVENTGTLKRDSLRLSKDVLGGTKLASVDLANLAEVSDSSIKRMAKTKALNCKAIYKEYLLNAGGDVNAVVDAWCDLYVWVSSMGIVPPDAEKYGVQSAVNRLLCHDWWRKRLRVKQARTIEKQAVKSGSVNLFKQIYCSDRTEARRQFQRDANSRILENIKAVNEQGQEYTLKALSDLSVSNPTIRRVELMTRINGFEQYSKNWGDVGEFYTLTCPSRMHPSPKSARGKLSKKYDGTTPREAQKYLTNQWEKARAKLHRNGVEVYGFRVVEPQHDGTPHWHLLLFMNPNHVLFVRSVLLEYALQVDGTENGATKYRFKPEAIKTGINPKTGKEYSAAGYIAKYISKAIDGFGMKEDLFGKDINEAAKRIEAWASTWGIRQFQQIGGASVTVWRELRRLGDEEINGSELLEKARQCANNGDWCGYCQLNWFKEVELLKRDLDGVGKYGDAKQQAIYGVETNGYGVVTRPHTWKVGEGLAETAEPLSTWTGVNNCTQENLEQALALFNMNFNGVYKKRWDWAKKQGFESISAYEQVKRVAMSEILEHKYGFKGGFKLSPELKVQLHQKWLEINPLEVLYDEFDEFPGGDFNEFCNEHFTGYAREYLWKKYGVILGGF